METVKMDASQCRDELFQILHRVVTDDERYVVATECGNAVIVSEETWEGLVETLCILSDPEMLSSLEEAESEYLDGCVEWRECLRRMDERPSCNEPPSDREQNSSEVGDSATEPFIEGMVIDTPEAAANLEALFESGVKWKRGDTKFRYNDPDVIRKFFEKHCKNEDMVIDTPEAAANLEALIESGVKWKRGNTEFTYGEVDDEFVREVTEKYGGKD